MRQSITATSYAKSLLHVYDILIQPLLDISVNMLTNHYLLIQIVHIHKNNVIAINSFIIPASLVVQQHSSPFYCICWLCHIYNIFIGRVNILHTFKYCVSEWVRCASVGECLLLSEWICVIVCEVFVCLCVCLRVYEFMCVWEEVFALAFKC